MKIFNSIILSATLFFFSACGTEEHIDTTRVFDLWDYMTSSSNYEVGYDIYENNILTAPYSETHRQFGDHYERQSATGTTTLFLGSSRILMSEPTGNIDVIRYVYLGDRGVFQSPSIQLCSFERFFDTYSTKGSTFYNVVQIACTTNSGVYQEFYYGYNEGIVSIYEKDGAFEKEYVKVSENPIL